MVNVKSQVLYLTSCSDLEQRPQVAERVASAETMREVDAPGLIDRYR